jgi:tape measure domain-containing protein
LAIVRELITLLGTEVDTAGFQQYETGIARIKEITKNLAATVGIAFSADKIIEFADGLVETGKEVNRLIAQLRVIARPIDDMNVAQQETFNIAQELGVAYKDVLGTYKEFQNEMKATNVPQEQVLKTTENIYKALQVGRASAEDMNQTMELFSRSFRRGGMRSMGVGMLSDIAPVAFDTLKAYFKTNEEGLRDLAKHGKITAEAIVAAFGSANADLDKQFALVPQKLGKVFTRIYNDLVNVTAQIYKLTEASVFMGKIVWYVWQQLTWGVRQLSDAVGGLKNLIQLLGIALAVALGPYLIRTLAMATAWTIRWAIANAALLVQWLAIGAAIAAVALGIQDLIFWIQGKESIIGTWVGPFDKLAENFKKLDIFAGLRVFDDLFKGDWQAAINDAKIALTSVQAIVLEITTLVGLAFVAWRGYKFVELIASIFNVKKAIEEVGGAANKTKQAIEEAGKAKWTKPGLGKEETPMGPGYGPRAAKGGIAYGLNILDPLMRMIEDRDRAEQGLPPAPKPLDELMKTDWGKQIEETYQNIRNTARSKIGLSTAPTAADTPPIPVVPIAPTPGAVPEVPSPGVTASVKSWLNETFGYLLPGMGKLGEAMTPEKKPLTFADWDKPKVAPGAIGPTPAGPVTNNVQPTFNQHNSIHVETALDAAQIGQIIGDRVGQLAGSQLDAFSRDLRVSSPRVESATQ